MDNRDLLLDCALTLFSQRGYDAVGVQEIVEAAGVTKPTLYHYFESKRGLLDSLIQRESINLISSLYNAAYYEGDLVRTLEKICGAYFSIAQLYSVFYRLQLSMLFSPPESEIHQAVRPYAQKQIEIITEVFVKAAEDHGNIWGRQKRYAAGFLGTINAMIGLYFSEELALTNQIVYQTVHQFMHGILS